MVNVAAPYGFKRWGTASSAPNFAFDSGQFIPGSTTVGGLRIASGYATAIFEGDLVRMNSSATGYVEQWAAADGSTATKIPLGIFVGCTYYSTSQRKIVENNYWPGSDATSDVVAKVITDPSAIFQCQAGVAAVPFSDIYIGSTADIVTGSGANGSTLTGISGMSLATPTTSNLLPFKVVGIVTSPPGVNGSDITTAYNNVLVSFNSQMFKNLLGV